MTKQTSLKTTVHLPKKEHYATRVVFGHSGRDWSNIGLRNPKTIQWLCSELAQRSPTNRDEITLKTKWTKAPQTSPLQQKLGEFNFKQA